MITIYVLTYNEDIKLPFFIKHYRKRFPKCNIVIYDNYSTDNTENIALNNNCQIIKYNTNNQLSDSKYLEIKNHCWKNAETDWVVVCDCDEFLDIDTDQLEKEHHLGTNIIKGYGWQMINMNVDSYNLDEMTYGIRNSFYDKCILFNKKYISEINYRAGCHKCKPIGKKIQLNYKKYNLFHFHNINENYIVDRHKIMTERMSELNKKLGWGIEYFMTRDEIKDEFESMRKNAVQVRYNI